MLVILTPTALTEGGGFFCIQIGNSVIIEIHPEVGGMPTKNDNMPSERLALNYPLVRGIFLMRKGHATAQPRIGIGSRNRTPVSEFGSRRSTTELIRQ